MGYHCDRKLIFSDFHYGETYTIYCDRSFGNYMLPHFSFSYFYPNLYSLRRLFYFEYFTHSVYMTQDQVSFKPIFKHQASFYIHSIPLFYLTKGGPIDRLLDKFKSGRAFYQTCYSETSTINTNAISDFQSSS